MLRMRKAFYLTGVATVLAVLRVCAIHANPLAVSNYEAKSLKWIIPIQFMQNNNTEAERLHRFVGHKQFDVF